MAVSDSHLGPGSKMPFLVEANPDGSEVTSTLPHRFVVPPNVTEVRIGIYDLPVFFTYKRLSTI